MKNECTLRGKNKKKATKVTRDDDSESESDDEVQEEVANMCFMAINHEVKSLKLDNDNLLDDEIDEKPSYNEFLDDLNDFHMKYEKLALKNITLKQKILGLTKELEELSEEKKMKLTCDVYASLKNENDLLNEKVIDLIKIVHNFTNGNKNFYLMLDGKKMCF